MTFIPATQLHAAPNHLPTPASATPTYGVFERGARFIGDLDHDLYNDPAQGSAWNEASAVGFQLMLISGMIGSGVLFLVGGSALFPAGAVLLAFTAVASLVTIAYAVSHGVNVRLDRSDIVRPRSLLVVVGAALHGAAIILDTPADTATTLGFITGLGLAMGVFAGVAIATSRNRQA